MEAKEALSLLADFRRPGTLERSSAIVSGLATRCRTELPEDVAVTILEQDLAGLRVGLRTALESLRPPSLIKVLWIEVTTRPLWVVRAEFFRHWMQDWAEKGRGKAEKKSTLARLVGFVPITVVIDEWKSPLFVLSAVYQSATILDAVYRELQEVDTGTSAVIVHINSYIFRYDFTLRPFTGTADGRVRRQAALRRPRSTFPFDRGRYVAELKQMVDRAVSRLRAAHPNFLVYTVSIWTDPEARTSAISIDSHEHSLECYRAALERFADGYVGGRSVDPDSFALTRFETVEHPWFPERSIWRHLNAGLRGIQQYCIAAFAELQLHPDAIVAINSSQDWYDAEVSLSKARIDSPGFSRS